MRIPNRINWASLAASMSEQAAQYSDPVAWAEQVSGNKLDPWQKDLMTSDHTRHLLLCSRQTGKSEAVAMRAAFQAVSNAGEKVLVLAPTQRQASLLYLRIQGFLRADPLASFQRSTRTELTLNNGSTIWSLPGHNPDTVRGFVASSVIIDEAAFARDLLLQILMPMLATTGGSLTMLSTPSGPEGIFYKAWEQESEGWTKTKVLAQDCPRITPEFLDELELRLGSLGFRQEVMCEFLASVNSYFNPDLIAAAFSQTPETTDLIARAFK